MPAAMELIHDGPVFADLTLYAAHPQVVAAGANRLLVSFDAAPRRDGVLHPPHDPTFRTYLVASDDGGRSWSEPFDPFPQAPSGVECTGLTRLTDGTIAMNRFTFDWRHPDTAGDGFDLPDVLRAELAGSVELTGIAADPRQIAHSRGPGHATLSFSQDGGCSWSPEVALDGGPFGAGCGLRGGLADTAGLQLHLSDPPRYRRVFQLFLDGQGRAIRPPELVAECPSRAFEEPAAIALDQGIGLLVMRENEGRSLWCCHRQDAMAGWGEPRPMGIGSSHPAALLTLGPSTVLLATGRRDPPAALLFFRSTDAGVTWAPLDASDLPPPDGPDHGYPALVRRDDGAIVLITYRRDEEGVTGLRGMTLGIREQAA